MIFTHLNLLLFVFLTTQTTFHIAQVFRSTHTILVQKKLNKRLHAVCYDMKNRYTRRIKNINHLINLNHYWWLYCYKLWIHDCSRYRLKHVTRYSVMLLKGHENKNNNNNNVRLVSDEIGMFVLIGNEKRAKRSNRQNIWNAM